MASHTLIAPVLPAPANPSLIGLSRAQIGEKLIELGLGAPAARMRAEQIFRWAYHYGHSDFSGMSNIAKGLRGDLAQAFSLARPEIVTRQVSSDGTRKWLIRLGSGAEVETVFIPDVARSGGAMRFFAGGLHLDVQILPYGLAKAGAQSQRLRNRRPGFDRAR